MKSVLDEVARLRQSTEALIRGSGPSRPAPAIEKRLAVRPAGGGPLMLHRNKVTGLANGHWAYRSKKAGVQNIDKSACSFSAIISSREPDRVNDIVEPRGAYLENYKWNPQVLFNHDSTGFPLGQAEDPQGRLAIEADDDFLYGSCWIAQSNRNAVDCFSLICERVIRCCSIGFSPIEATPRGHTDEDGLHVASFDLLEFSAVIIPAAPKAVITGTDGADELEQASFAADRIAAMLARDRIAHKGIDPVLRKSLQPYAAPRRSQVVGGWPTWEKAMNQPSRKDYMEGQDIGANTGRPKGPQGRFLEGQDIGSPDISIRDGQKDLPTINDEDAGTNTGGGGLGRCQAVILDMRVFPTKPQARRWLIGNSYSADELVEVVDGPSGPVKAEPGEGDFWLARQPVGTKPASGRRIVDIANGVRGVFVDPA